MKCPKCGKELRPEGLEYWCDSCRILYGRKSDDEETKTKTNSNNYKGYVPVGCKACGGPYPDCKSSCSIFDND